MNNHSLAFVFPGQGSQHVGMLADAVTVYPEISATFSRASDTLGYDLQQLALTGPEEKLNQTEYTQPALLAASYAIWCVIQKHNPVKPAVLAGHSLGEYTALVCANALKFEDAIKLVAARGRFMQSAVAAGTGGMAAIIGLDNDAVTAICTRALNSSGEVLAPANFNSTGQVVIAGHLEAVNRAIVLAKENGAKMAVMIPVSVPSHCELMRPAANQLAELLNTIDIQTPNISVISNADVSVYQNADEIRDGLTRQLYMPVRWVETIQKFKSMDVTTIIECGPGKILTGLNKRIDKSFNFLSVNDAASIDALFGFMNEGNPL